MNATLKKGSLLLLVVFCFGFKGGEIVELEGYFNARYSANFLKSTQNVKFVMPPGTRARIEETKAFSSGNHGLKVQILSGPQKGQSAWVYYKSSDPDMKLFASEQDMKKEQTTTQVEQASHVRTTRKTEALRTPAGETAEKVVEHITQGNRAVQKHGKPGGPCEGCEVSNLHARDVAPARPSSVSPSATKWTPMASGSDKPVITPPTRTQNPFGIRSVRCGTKAGAYDLCSFGDDPAPGKIRFFNRGPNKIVSTGESRSREWSFNFEGGARQDIGISISDMPNGTISQTQESYIMLFPRVTLPNIRTEGNRQIVTLPNGETVTYNAQTKEVIGGVFSEDGPLTSGGKELSPAKVSYKGNGVMLRIDRRGEEPRLGGGQATITKQGRSCKVPVKDLWPDQSEKSPVHFKYFSDSDFDAYLKRKCGFGL